MCAAGDAGMLSGRPQLQPSFSLHVEFGGGAATWSGHGIAFQQKVPVTRHVGFEVRPRRCASYCVVLHLTTVSAHTLRSAAWYNIPHRLDTQLPCSTYASTYAILHYDIVACIMHCGGDWRTLMPVDV